MKVEKIIEEEFDEGILNGITNPVYKEIQKDCQEIAEYNALHRSKDTSKFEKLKDRAVTKFRDGLINKGTYNSIIKLIDSFIKYN